MKWMTMLGFGMVMAVSAGLLGCHHIEEPWTDYAAEYKLEKFETTSPEAQLRHRLQYTQTDR